MDLTIKFFKSFLRKRLLLLILLVILIFYSIINFFNYNNSIADADKLNFDIKNDIVSYLI